MMPSWLDYAGPTRGDKELGEYVTGVLKHGNGVMPTTAMARNDEEAAKIRDLIKGRHGAKVVVVQTPQQLEAAHQTERSRHRA